MLRGPERRPELRTAHLRGFEILIRLGEKAIAEPTWNRAKHAPQPPGTLNGAEKLDLKQAVSYLERISDWKKLRDFKKLSK